jgi:hypothetical protein
MYGFKEGGGCRHYHFNMSQLCVGGPGELRVQRKRGFCGVKQFVIFHWIQYFPKKLKYLRQPDLKWIQTDAVQLSIKIQPKMAVSLHI